MGLCIILSYHVAMCSLFYCYVYLMAMFICVPMNSKNNVVFATTLIYSYCE